MMAEENNTQAGCSGSCESCASAGNCSGAKFDPADLLEPMNALSDIKHVIGVVSGKGGVGKSFVTGALAVQLAKKGYKVGILDADITGPSIQKMFGMTNEVEGNVDGILPGVSKGGIKIMSINMLLDSEDTPVLWRGPVIAGVVKQFWKDVVWGELDFLLVDMPPGTGDVPMTVFQSLPVDGIMIVTSPQSLVNMIVKKAYRMAGTMKIKVLGIIENYSYLVCPDCGKHLNVFGESDIDNIAAEIGLKVLGKLPIDPELAKKSDDGEFDDVVLDEILPAVDRLEMLYTRTAK